MSRLDNSHLSSFAPYINDLNPNPTDKGKDEEANNFADSKKDFIAFHVEDFRKFIK